MLWSHVSDGKAACDCGPDFCRDDGRVAAAFDSKRQVLAEHGYPKRLIDLFDLPPRCVAAAERAPDTFSLMHVARNEDKDIREWSVEAEAAAALDLKASNISSYHILNVRHSFACCGDPHFSQRSDNDRLLDLNTDAAINNKK